MSAYLLDTNICVYLINGKFELASRLLEKCKNQ